MLNFGRMLVEGPTPDILANDEVAAVCLGTQDAWEKTPSRIPISEEDVRATSEGTDPRQALAPSSLPSRPAHARQQR